MAGYQSKSGFILAAGALLAFCVHWFSTAFLGHNGSKVTLASFQLSQPSVGTTWKLVEKGIDSKHFNAELSVFQEITEKTPISDDECCLFKFSNKIDFSWAIFSNRRITFFAIKHTEQGLSDSKTGLIRREIEGAETVNQRLSEVRAWAGGHPRPLWLEVQEKQRVESPLCVYVKDKDQKVKVFSLTSDDPQVLSLVRLLESSV